MYAMMRNAWSIVNDEDNTEIWFFIIYWCQEYDEYLCTLISVTNFYNYLSWYVIIKMITLIMNSVHWTFVHITMTIIMIISMMTMLPRVWWIFVHIAALQWESEQSMKRDCASGHMYDDIWAWGWWWRWCWWWSYTWWHMTMMMMFSDQRIRFGERFIKKPTKVLAREGFRSFRCCRNMIFANDPILFVIL